MKNLINQLITNNNLSFLSGYTDWLLGSTYEVLDSNGEPFSKESPNTNAKRQKQVSQLLKEIGREDYKVHLLPDVSKFNITLGLFSPLLLAFGLLGRMSSHITLHKGENKKFNKYILRLHKILLLHLKKGDMAKYWALQRVILQRSHVFLIRSLHLIDKNIYRTKTLRQLVKTLKECNKLRKNLSTSLEFHRVYIPKNERNESFRPLGVPTLAWRIYLNLLSHPLVLAAPVNQEQHGFTPSKGTMTAWSSILTNVIKSPNIYEIDLKQCFPSINLQRLRHIMITKYNFPKWVANMYTQLNHNHPEFKGAILMNETQSLLLEASKENLSPQRKSESFDDYLSRIIKSLRIHFANKLATHLVGTIGSGSFNITQIGYNQKDYPKGTFEDVLDQRGQAYTGISPDILKSFFNSFDYEPGIGLKFQEDAKHLLFRPAPPDSIDIINREVAWLAEIGTAQGSPLSPYLSAIALQEISEGLPEGVYVIMYADDMLFYGPGLQKWLNKNSDNLYKYLSSLGFTMHKEKSGWVKSHGFWDKPLKFLGLEYDGETRVLRASTRKGSHLVLNQTIIELLNAEFDLNLILGKKATLLSLAKQAW